MTREDYINTLELDNAELRKENEELKSQLRGTTHCFDEEEHNRLKEEITNLSKDVDMWNSKYNDMFDENKELKKQLEEINNFIKKCGFKNIQQVALNYCGLLKQQKEFINYLESWKENEEYCYLASNPIDRCRKDIYKEVLQKYKEIIGVSDENNKQ